MVTSAISDRGMQLWHDLSADEALSNLPPLNRLIRAVRERSKSSEEMIELAFTLCEANMEIGRHEYGRWQGLAIVDATWVFSMQGLAGDLIGNYDYDFWGVLRAIAGLARRSCNPAQYHQCINLNLFKSPAEDELVLKRFHSLSTSNDINNFGCMTRATTGLETLLPKSPVSKASQSNNLTINPNTHPLAYSSFGRSNKYTMDGQLIARSPFCFNVWLERPLAWLCSVDLRDLSGALDGSQIDLTYDLKLDNPEDAYLHVLLSATETNLEPVSRNERHAWMLDKKLPLDATNGICLHLQSKEWKPLAGNANIAYGLKFTVENLSDTLERLLPLELIFALEMNAKDPVPTGRLVLPTLTLRQNKATVTQL